jgi:serine/threonine-protein kinase
MVDTRKWAGGVAGSTGVNDFTDDIVAISGRRVGSTLRGKWRLDALLGVGGMSAVYAATHRNGTRAAVKVMHAVFSDEVRARQRFAWEGRVANAVAHPGVVRVLDDDVADDGALFLVTELLEGETLDARREHAGGRLPQDEVLIVFDSVLDVLAAAHERGIVHRDLKPENLFLTRDGRIKLLDFGIARLRESPGENRLTQAGDLFGTPEYMSPEQARGLWDEVDAQSDLFSVGASMFHAVSGVVVHEGQTGNEPLFQAMSSRARALATVAPDVAPEVAWVVDRALEFEKERRWRDATEMRGALAAAFQAVRRGPISAAVPAWAEVPWTPARAPAPAIPPPVMTDRPVEIPETELELPVRHTPTMIAGIALASLVLAGAGLASLGIFGARQGPVAGVESPAPTSAASAVARRARVDSSGASAQRRDGRSADADGFATPRSPRADAEGLIKAGPPVPEFAASSLPLVGSPPVAPLRPARASQSAAAPSPPVVGSALHEAACSPPFVVDPRDGTKHWNVECL